MSNNKSDAAPQDGYFAVCPLHDFAPYPDYAKVKITNKLMERLGEMHNIAVTHELTEVRSMCGGEIMWGSDELCGALRLELEELVVTMTGLFWFTASLKFSGRSIETEAIHIPELSEKAGAATAPGCRLIFGDLDADRLDELIAEG